MNMKVYCVTNLLSGLSDGLFLYPTDKAASVELAPLYVRTKGTPLDEVVLNYIGDFDTSSRKLTPSDDIVPVEWDCRRLRESSMQRKTVEEVEKNIADIN